MNRADVYHLIDKERDRQHVKWGTAHDWGDGDCSSPNVPVEVKAVVLAEECGEVARAVLDIRSNDLRAELVQVAAVAVAWIEGMEP